jgi:hypothetical protein
MMPRTTHTPSSTALASIVYDDESNECFITFTDGRSYTLENFPEIELDRWLGAQSVGAYWNANIKGRY